MEFTETKLKGVWLIRLRKIEDERGHFARVWCQDELLKHGLNPQIAQMNLGYSHRCGTIRGLHYQAAPHAEAKLIRCTRGAIFEAIVDLRKDSPTAGQWCSAEITADNGLMVYVPEGCAHGYQTLQDGTEAYYTTSAAYAPAAVRGARYDDAAFGIQWPLPVSVISKADLNWPKFDRASLGGA